jgi:hypothetical protein
MNNFQKLCIFGSIAFCGQTFSSSGLARVSQDDLLESYRAGVGDPTSEVCRISEDEQRLVKALLLKWKITSVEQQLSIFLEVRKLLQGIKGSSPRAQILDSLVKIDDPSLFTFLTMYADQVKNRVNNSEGAHEWDILQLLELLSSHKKEERLILFGAASEAVHEVTGSTDRSRVFWKIWRFPAENRLALLKQVLGSQTLDKSDAQVVLASFDGVRN